MNIGFLGLGKLGLPVALAVESCGYSVGGFDISPKVQNIVSSKIFPYKEDMVGDYLKKSNIKFMTIEKMVNFADLIFVSIQTPHQPEHEGITRIPEGRADFDYSYLINGIQRLSQIIESGGRDKIIAIISTVLPGTIRRKIKPLLGPRSRVCYNPFFIAMGTVIQDFLNPEFVLLGIDDSLAGEKLEYFYSTVCNAPCYKTNIENAELIKVFYNTFISTKLAFANTVMEICHKTNNANADDVIGALKIAKKRIISDRYLDGGMGDGGACHPHDNIALGYLADKIDLSFDWFGNIMKQREKHTEWLADLIIEHAGEKSVIILGKSFKAESDITTGSPSLLLKNLLKEKGLKADMWDPLIDNAFEHNNKGPYLYFIGTKHKYFQNFPFVKASTVLDPWRYISDRDGIKIIRIGE